VVEEHFDEAAFYFERWEACLDSPRYTLDELQVGPEESLFAHLDGLLAAGDEARRKLLWPAVESTHRKVDPSMVTAASLALLRPEAFSDQPIERLLWILSTAAERSRRAIGRALGLAEHPAIDEQIRTALVEARDARATTQAALLAIADDRNIDPDAVITRYLRSDNENTLRAALLAVRHVSSPALYGSFVEDLLDFSSMAVRAAALETAVLWKLPSALPACLRMAGNCEPQALLMAALLGGESSVQCIRQALRDEPSRAASLWALGFCGRVEAVEGCLPHLDDPDATVARLAGEAFSAITGLDLDREPYCLPEPDDDEPHFPLTELDTGAHVPVPTARAWPEDPAVMSEDVKTCADFVLLGTADLPLPNAAMIRQWWHANRPRFQSDVRYCAGQPWLPCSPPAMLERLSMRRRHAVLFALAVHSGGRPPTTRTFSAVQRSRAPHVPQRP
jgi:uncharacterized protein (TIGR02270 family)